jgi:hypothetical protein
MRRYGIYDATRGLMTAMAVGLAGLLLWSATQVGQQSTLRFWASMGIVAGAGLLLALLPALGGWTKGLRLRMSPGTLALGFIPTLVLVGWVLLATQPGQGWHEGRFVSWSHDLGVMGVVHALGLWHGALAFGFGAVLGMSIDSVPAVESVEAPGVEHAAERPRWRRRPAQATAADEPMSAERAATPADTQVTRERVPSE